MAEPLHVVVDDDTETIRVDPETGTVETDQPDGSVIVHLDARKPKDDDGEDDWFANLADEVGDSKLGMIANDLIEAIQADDTSRKGHLDNKSRIIDLLGLKLQEPKSTVGDSSAGIEGMSSVTNPLMLEAVLKGWANAQAELLPASGPVKIKDDGHETTDEDDLADSLERDVNHWFTTTASEYYPDTSHMLLWGVYLGGAGFKKVYRCPMRRRPTSESVDDKNLIVSDTTKSFRNCARITHEIPMRPSVMKRMKFIGAYRDVGLTQPTPTPNVVDTTIAGIQGTTPQKDRPEDQEYTIWESQCELDLDEFVPANSKLKGEGIPLPYLVTIDKDSREILAIRRDWNEDDEECERKRMYVKYPYIPGPGFYGTGLGGVLANSSAAMTAAWREALDAGMFASFPGGLISEMGARQNTANFRVSPGEFASVKTNGLPITQAVMAMPYRDVTPGLMAMMDKITEQSKSVGGVADIPAGEGMQNVPVGTMLATIEQATKIMAAAHKGMHTAQSEELQLILDLFRDNPEDFWRSNKVCPKDYWTEQRFIQALDNCNLVPVSDPNVPSHIHRVAKAIALIQLKQAFPGLMSDDEILHRCLIALREDPIGLVLAPEARPPMPSPQEDPSKMIMAQAKMQEAQTNAQKVQVDAAAQGQDDQVKAAEIQAKERIANLDLQKEVIIHAHDAQTEQDKTALMARQQQHEEQTTAAEQQQSHAEHVTDAITADRQHGLATAQAGHDMVMDHAAHALAVKESNKPPPKPAPAKPKGKT